MTTPGAHGGFNPFRDDHGRWATRTLAVGAASRTPVGDGAFHASGGIYPAAHLQPLQPGEVVAATHRGVRIVIRQGLTGVKPESGSSSGNPVAVAFTADGQVTGITSIPQSLATPRALAKALAKAETAIADANATADARRTPGARQFLTDDDVRAFLADHQDWTARQTPAQAAAIHQYQKDSDQVNAALRSGFAPTGDGAAIHAGLTAQVTPAKAAFRTYRGTNTAYLGGELAVGATFNEKGWTSTSLSDAFVHDYATRADGTFAASTKERGRIVPGVLEITVAQGQSYVPAMRAGEGVERIPLSSTRTIKADAPTQPSMKFGEVILPPGTTYRVTGKRYEQQGRRQVPVYTVEIVPT